MWLHLKQILFELGVWLLCELCVWLCVASYGFSIEPPRYRVPMAHNVAQWCSSGVCAEGAVTSFFPSTIGSLSADATGFIGGNATEAGALEMAIKSLQA